MRTLIVSAAIILVFAASDALSTPSDERVRVTHGSNRTKTVGSLVSKTPDELIINRDGDGASVSVSTASISVVERSLGQRHNAGKGALIGGGLSLALGLGMAVAASSGENPDFIGGDVILAAAVVMVSVGAGLGAIIGYGVRTEHWKPVLREELRIGVSWSRNAPKVALKINF